MKTIPHTKKNMDQEEAMLRRGLSKGRGWHFFVLRFLAGAVGFILLVASLLKATEMELFIRQIRGYDIISRYEFLVIGAWGLITLEMVLGVALLIFYRPRLVLPSTAILMLIFVGVNSWAWLTSATTDCGCFGAWIKRTPGEGAVEGLIMLAVTLLAWVGCRPMQRPKTRAKAWVVGTACLIGFMLPLTFGFSISRINQPLPGRAEIDFRGLQIQGLENVDLRHGDYLIILMDTDCDHCQEGVEQLNELAKNNDLPAIVALCTNEEILRERFEEEFQPFFPIGQIGEDAFWRLLESGDIPRTMLVRDGHVKQVWDQTIPRRDMIKVEPRVSMLFSQTKNNA
jgi:hypothetical protein